MPRTNTTQAVLRRQIVATVMEVTATTKRSSDYIEEKAMKENIPKIPTQMAMAIICYEEVCVE